MAPRRPHARPLRRVGAPLEPRRLGGPPARLLPGGDQLVGRAHVAQHAHRQHRTTRSVSTKQGVRRAVGRGSFGKRGPRTAEELLGADGEHGARRVDYASEPRERRVVARAGEHLLGKCQAALVEFGDARDGDLQHRRLERGQQRGHANDQAEEEHHGAIHVEQPRVPEAHRKEPARDDAGASEVQQQAAHRERFAPARVALDDDRAAAADDAPRGRRVLWGWSREDSNSPEALPWQGVLGTPRVVASDPHNRSRLTFYPLPELRVLREDAARYYLT